MTGCLFGSRTKCSSGPPYMNMAYALFLIKASLAKISNKWEKKKGEIKKTNNEIYIISWHKLSHQTYVIEKTMKEQHNIKVLISHSPSI